jgi:hypothetical protein
MTTSIVQVAILLVIGMVIGIHFTALSLAQTIGITLLLSFCLTSLCLTTGYIVCVKTIDTSAFKY